MSLEENIQAIQAAVGPKRVKTPQEEVEQFSLAELLKAANSRGTRKPFLNNITFVKAVPKNGRSCEDVNTRPCEE
jgi:hypothetical protein